MFPLSLTTYMARMRERLAACSMANFDEALLRFAYCLVNLDARL